MHPLERLAMNPHYKMSQKQLKKLEELRHKQDKQIHYSTPPKQFSPVPKNQPKLEKHNDTETE